MKNKVFVVCKSKNCYLKALKSYITTAYMPSSVVSAIRYDAATSTLRIIFVSGKVYDYKDVPEEVFNAMKTSFSKGTYFNQYIKDRYPFEKVR